MKKQSKVALTQTASGVNPIPPNHDGDYAGFLASIKTGFGMKIQAVNPPLFTTDVNNLYGLFMSKLDQRYTQVHNCNTCRRFFETFGGLVTIVDGKAISAMWDEISVPAFYKDAVDAIRRVVEKAAITGVFYSEDATLGTPETGDHRNPFKRWEHISVQLPRQMLWKQRILTPFQGTAEKLQDFQTMQRALAEFTLPAVEQAVTLLKSESLYRSEKCLGVAEWLRDLMVSLKASRSQRKRDLILWRAVATAPTGFAHPRSSMIGTLLEDIMSGMDFAQVSKRFADKMNPTQYMRPQAAPSAGNVSQAEKILKRLEADGSLSRRYAKLEDIKLFWSPSQVAKPRGLRQDGLFGNLKTKEQLQKNNVIKTPDITMTWDKFRRQILPNAAEIFMETQAMGSYTGLVTAVDPYAPPILQWDFDDARNPVSWYVYSSGSAASNWNIQSNQFVKVTGLTDQPSMWGRPIPSQGESSVVILEGCRDIRGSSSLCLFPEILKAEFHSIRSTIEAYSNTRPIEGKHHATACGYRVEKNKPLNIRFRVTEKNGNQVIYKIDRWD